MRLNAGVRSEITRNATKVLRDREIALEKREHGLCARCYVIAYPVALRNLFAAVQEASPRTGFLNTKLQVRFNVAGQGVLMRSHEYLVVPTNYYQNMDSLGAPITMEKHEKLVNEVRAWQTDMEQYRKDMKQAEVTLKTVLKSVGSTETLFKVWPEGKKFYSVPPLTPQAKINVPAVQMQALNEMLGLHA